MIIDRRATKTSLSALIQEIEDAWNAGVRATAPPNFIIVSDSWRLACRRMMRPAHRLVAGSSARAIKRRAVRRPW